MVLPEIKRKALCTAIVQRAKRSAVPPLFCLSQSARILSHVPVSFPVRSCPLTLTRRENLLCTTTCFLLSFNPPVQKLPSMTTSLDGLSAGEPSSLSGFFMYSSFSLPLFVQVVLIISVFPYFVKTKKIKIFCSILSGRSRTWFGIGGRSCCSRRSRFLRRLCGAGFLLSGVFLHSGVFSGADTDTGSLLLLL